jgi:hypothetical protein
MHISVAMPGCEWQARIFLESDGQLVPRPSSLALQVNIITFGGNSDSPLSGRIMFDGSCLLQNEIINAGMAIAAVSQPTPPHLRIASFVSQSWTGALVLECVVALLHFSFTD